MLFSASAIFALWSLSRNAESVVAEDRSVTETAEPAPPSPPPSLSSWSDALEDPSFHGAMQTTTNIHTQASRQLQTTGSRSSANVWNEETQLTRPPLTSLFKMDISGDVIIVTTQPFAEGDDDDQEDWTAFGKVSVHQYDGVGGWKRIVDELRVSEDLPINDIGGFGRSIAISPPGDTIVVGAPDSNRNGIDSGLVFVFAKTLDGEWREVAQLEQSNPQVFQRFGSWVAVSEDTIVAAPETQNPSFDNTMFYVFEKDACGVWKETYSYDQGPEIGYSLRYEKVAISGGTIVLMDHIAKGLLVAAKDESGNWSTRKLVPSAFIQNPDIRLSGFDISGNTIVASAFVPSGIDPTFPGAVYVFQMNTSGSWSEGTKLPISSAKDRFPMGVSVSGDRIVVRDFGSVLVYESNGTNSWSVVAELPASLWSKHSQRPNNFFGDFTFVDISGDVILVNYGTINVFRTPCKENKITGFKLVNANLSIAGPLPALLNKATFPNVRQILAEFSSCDSRPIRTVKIVYDNGVDERCEKKTPYTIPGLFSIGEHSVKATPFSSMDCSGSPSGESLEASFAVTNDSSCQSESCQNKITDFTLVNKNGASAGSLSPVLVKANILDLREIQAEFSSCDDYPIESIQFDYDNGRKRRCENFSPYGIVGFYTLGDHTVKATPYTGPGCTDLEGVPAGISREETFSIIGGSCQNKITDFTLVNKNGASAGSLSPVLVKANILDLREIQAEFSSCDDYPIESIQFDYDNGRKRRCENFSPYGIVGFYTLGDHTVKATPYTGPGCTDLEGVPAGISREETFSIIGGSCQNKITDFKLVNGDDSIAGNVPNVLNKAQFPNVRQVLAEFTSCRTRPIRSVRIDYDNGVVTRCEDKTPYTIPGIFTNGVHTVKATPYTGLDCNKGTPGVSLEKVFTIIGGNPGRARPNPGGNTRGDGCTIGITGFTIFNRAGKSEGKLNRVIDRSEYPRLRKIVANVNSCGGKIGSVLMIYDGKKRCEKFADYGIIGDLYSVGLHSIEATPYTNSNCKGPSGTTRMMRFRIQT